MPDRGVETTADPRVSWVARSATIAFVAALALSVPVILHANRAQWFVLDEWDFLAQRDLGDPSNLLRPHNEHWVTTPAVLYRILYRVVGLHHYWPYLLLTVAAHLLAVTLLRVLMRQVDVHPWIATVTCTAMLYLGSGRMNIGWAFQVTFTGALAMGLAHLVLANHDGPLGRRDVLGLMCGVVAISMSAIAVAMVAVVGVAVLLRRDLRAAAFHVIPPALLYVAWYLAFASSSLPGVRPTPGRIVRFTGWGLVDSIVGLAHLPVVAILVVAVLVVGTWLAFRQPAESHHDDSRRYAAVVTLASGSVVMLVMMAFGRGLVLPVGYGQTMSRYTYLLVACLLPAIALAATSVAQRWRGMLLPVLLILAVGIPWNVGELEPSGADRYLLGQPDLVVAMADAAAAQRPPRGLEPLPTTFKGLTAGWLMDARRQGRLPERQGIPESVKQSASLMMDLDQIDRVGSRRCRPVEDPARVVLAKGSVLKVRAGMATITRHRNGEQAGTASYGATVANPGSIALVALSPSVISLSVGGAEPSAVYICS